MGNEERQNYRAQYQTAQKKFHSNANLLLAKQQSVAVENLPPVQLPPLNLDAQKMGETHDASEIKFGEDPETSKVDEIAMSSSIENDDEKMIIDDNSNPSGSDMGESLVRSSVGHQDALPTMVTLA